MSNVIMFPLHRLKTVYASPLVLYSIAEYQDLPRLEYTHFAPWNPVYLNDRNKGASHSIPATMLGKPKQFLVDAFAYIEGQLHNKDCVDVGKIVYNGLFELLSHGKQCSEYSIANNSVGSFSQESSRVHLDILCTLQLKQRSYLRIGFKSAITRLPQRENRDAIQSNLMEQEAL